MKKSFLVLSLVIGSASTSLAQTLSYGGVGGIDMGNGIKMNSYGGVQLTPTNDPYKSSNSYKGYSSHMDEKKREEQRRTDDILQRQEADRKDAARKKAENDKKVQAAQTLRHMNSQETAIPSSWDGSIVSDDIEVSGVKNRQTLVYGYNVMGEMVAGGFAIVPSKDKSKWVHVEWSQSKSATFAYCYARYAVSGKLAYNGLPINSKICRSMLASQFSMQKSGDGKERCFESSLQGHFLNQGAPVDVGYCDRTKAAGTLVNSTAGTGRKEYSFINLLYAAPLRACLKGSMGKAIQPAVVVPAELCPGLNLNKAAYKKVTFKVTPQTADIAKYLKQPESKTLCALVDTESNLLIGMQIDESQCK